MAPPPPPPTEVETVTGETSNLKLSGAPKLSQKEQNAKKSDDLVKRFRLYHEDKAPFDIPGSLENANIGPSPFADKPLEGSSAVRSYTPQRSTGKLDNKYKYIETTPRLGREYKNAKLTDILADEELLHDLAITISERGVVFFPGQHDISIEDQKKLTLALAKAAKFPEGNKLHIHPTALAGGLLAEDGKKIDPEVNFINSKLRMKLYAAESGKKWSKGSDTVFHSDVTFEPIPGGFSLLRVVETPSSTGTEEELNSTRAGAVGGSGGDTLWANGYALAEKISPSFLSYLETLKGEFYQPIFKDGLKKNEVPLWSGVRGAPENIGDVQLAVHPLIRTNPSTGWKSVFAIGSHFHRVVGVTDEESELIKKYLNDLLYQSPEIQLRFKWNAGDIGIWDNRSTYHSAITDIFNVNGEIENRTGLRTMSIAERPFFDPASTTQIEGLRKRHAASN